MVWNAVAAIGGAAISALGSNRAAKKATQGNAEEIAFAREQYQDWLDTFGDIRDNLSQFYGEMTPEFIQSQELQFIEQERTKALERIEVDMAQRGIGTSGLATQLRQDVELGAAEDRARVRAEAPRKSAQEKLNFLQVGLNQNPAPTLQNVLSNRASRLNQVSTTAGQEAGKAIGAAVDTTFDVLADRLNDTTPDTPTQVGAPINTDPNTFRGLG